MIAHYGYRDARGEFYVTIDTGRCARCGDRPCIGACPRGLFREEENPYGETVVAIREDARRRLEAECSGCKPTRRRGNLPCMAACPFDALSHSW